MTSTLTRKELDERIYAFERPSRQEALTASEERELQRLRARRDEMVAAEQLAARRREVASVLQPCRREDIASAYVWELSELAVDLTVKHNLRAVHSRLRDARSSRSAQTISTRGIKSEAAFATWAHEFTHVTDARADAEQSHFTEVGASTLCSFRAEAFAWLGAINITPKWTAAMQWRLRASVASYLTIPATSLQERADQDLLYQVINIGFKAVKPSPDSLEGKREWLAGVKRPARIIGGRAMARDEVRAQFELTIPLTLPPEEVPARGGLVAAPSPNPTPPGVDRLGFLLREALENVRPRQVRKIVERDQNGRIVAVVEQEVDGEEAPRRVAAIERLAALVNGRGSL